MSYPNVAQKLPPNIMYQNPTISGLAEYIAGCVQADRARNTNGVIGVNGINGHPVNGQGDRRPNKRDELQSLVDKYTSELSRTLKRTRKDRIILTGSSGSFGINILASLVESPDVEKVYAFSRRPTDGTSLTERHLHALKRSGLRTSLLDSRKVVLVESDLTLPDFGLDPDLLAEVRRFAVWVC